MILKAPIITALATYTYDHNGNLTTVTGTSPTTYTWDYNNRIASSTTAGTTIQYAYDQSGQRIAQKNLSTLTTTLYPTQTYDIDYNGSMGTSTQTNHFSTEGTLLATLTTPTLSNYNAGTCVFSSMASTTLTSNCTVSGTVLLPYSLTVSSSTKVTLSATSTLLVDLKHNKVLVKQGSGILIKHGGTLRQVKASDTQPTLSYDFTDHLGSVTLSTDASSTITETTDYYPYGGQRVDTKTGTQNESRKFIGQTFDSSTQLSYLNARYMDNVRGQFLSEDSLFLAVGNPQIIKQISGQDQQVILSNPQQINSYSYATQNPVKYSDPQGTDIYWRSDGTLAKFTDTGSHQYFESQDISMLNYNASIGESNKYNLPLFYNYVNTGQAWDYKNNQDGRGYYFFNGELVSAEEFGNLNYGYTGTAFGIGSTILTDAAGINQILKSGKQNKGPTLTNFSGNFDDPRDTTNIRTGISTYNSAGRENSSTNYAAASNIGYNATISGIIRSLSAAVASIKLLLSKK